MSGSNLNIARDSCNLDTNNENVSVVENNLTDTLQDNLQQQLSSVLERIEDRTKFRDINDANDQLKEHAVVDVNEVDMDLPDGPSQSQGGPLNAGGSINGQLNELQCQIELLKRDKRALEKQLHNISVQGYVYQKGMIHYWKVLMV